MQNRDPPRGTRLGDGDGEAEKEPEHGLHVGNRLPKHEPRASGVRRRAPYSRSTIAAIA